MGLETAAVIGLVGVGLGAIGAGVTAYSQHQQGKAQNLIASFNARQQELASKQQLMASQTQAELEKQQAEANFNLRKAEADARNNNAKAIESQALAQDAVNRLNLRSRREEYGRMQATQRATIAASGIAESTGTPLDLLAETAGKIQQDAEEQFYIGEVERRTLFSEAAMERLGGKLALAGATLDRDSGVAAAGLRTAAAKGEYLAGLRGAEISRLSGKSAEQAGKLQAGATLFSAAGSAVESYNRYNPPKPKFRTS